MYTIVLVWRLGLGCLRGCEAHPKAYSRSGWPSDERTYKDASGFVVSYSEAYASDHIRGRSLAPHSCYNHVRNICKVELRRRSEDLEREQSAMHNMLASWADDCGKLICNAASKLVLFECVLLDGGALRLWFLLARAMFSPKAQWWVECAESSSSSSGSSGAIGGDLSFPVEVEIVSARSLVCPSIETAKVVTSDELALQLARFAGAGRLRCWDMPYRIAEVPTLLKMVVGGHGAALPLGRRAAARSTNTAMSDVRAVLGGSGRQTFVEHAGLARRPVAPRPRRQARQDSGGVVAPSSQQPAGRGDSELDVPQSLAIDDIPADTLAEWAETDLASAAEIADEFADQGAPAIEAGPASDADPQEAPDMVPGVSSSSAAQAEGEDADAALVETVGPDEGDAPAAGDLPDAAARPRVIGPSSLGYMLDVSENKPAARLTAVWKGSVAIKCYKHGSKCTLAVAEWRLPSLEALRGWASSAEWPPSGTTTAQKEAMAKEHIATLRGLRDDAVWPGRTRQHLIDEAFVLDASAP